MILNSGRHTQPDRKVAAFFCPSPLPFACLRYLSLTRGPAGSRTTTGSLSATQECRDTNWATRTSARKVAAWGVQGDICWHWHWPFDIQALFITLTADPDSAIICLALSLWQCSVSATALCPLLLLSVSVVSQPVIVFPLCFGQWLGP